MKYFAALLFSVTLFMACSGDSSSSTSATTPNEGGASSRVDSSSSSSVIPGLTGNLTDSRDGQTYKTVAIGNQTWMAENLNYETANSYCYNDESTNCTKYGRLYTWAAAITACPSGWHLPDSTEWETLFAAIGGQTTAGKILKSTSGWYDDGNGTDDISFSAKAIGRRNEGGDYYDEGYNAHFWSSTESDGVYAYNLGLYYNDEHAYLDYKSKTHGYSVRCLQNWH